MAFVAEPFLPYYLIDLKLIKGTESPPKENETEIETGISGIHQREKQKNKQTKAFDSAPVIFLLPL
jgi:hypothetical protein